MIYEAGVYGEMEHRFFRPSELVALDRVRFMPGYIDAVILLRKCYGLSGKLLLCARKHMCWYNPRYGWTRAYLTMAEARHFKNKFSGYKDTAFIYDDGGIYLLSLMAGWGKTKSMMWLAHDVRS